MRRILRKTLQILDGTPAVYGKRQSGQSMVELALVTPILIILLAGLVEIGWFANNYLSILDVTRAGARRATVLVDDQAPNADAWLPGFTYVPHSYLSEVWEVPYRMPYVSVDTAGQAAEEAARRLYRAEPPYNPNPPNPSACRVDRLFYNEVICTMLLSMDPLELNPDNGIDDIIISGYSVEMVNAAAHPIWLPAAARPVAANLPQLVVAGRYPANANECDVTETTPGNYAVVPREPRDPFDFNMNGIVDNGTSPTTIDNVNDFKELTGYDALGVGIIAAEKQVGFSLYGNHKIPRTLCVGSEWTMRDVENLMNMPNYSITDAAARAMLPGQGMVMVEMYWEHEMLLQIPVLSPVFTAVGNSEGKMVINVWAAFPLPSVEPYIIFPA